jgi:hypothetical protein
MIFSDGMSVLNSCTVLIKRQGNRLPPRSRKKNVKKAGGWELRIKNEELRMRVFAGVRTKVNAKNGSLQFTADCLKIRTPISFFILHYLTANAWQSVINIAFHG